MQRVLSFQVGRDFSEPSEFVTTRTCISSVFSVGFLCLLGGFLLGKFVSDGTLLMREQRMLQELSGNGLDATKDMQLGLLDLLNETQFYEDYEMGHETQSLRRQGINGVKDIFSDLSIFRLNVNETKSCTVATICGVQEPDRYVVFSASGEGFDVAIKVATALDNIYRNKGWEPKRTIIFCVFLGSKDYCKDTFLRWIKPQIVAYIAVHGNAARGSDEIVVSGSGMVQATILDAMDEINFYHGNQFNGTHSLDSLPRLELDVPHAVLSFLNKNSSSDYIELNQKILAQIVGLTMWRLSEEIFFQWNPKYFNEIVNNTLSTIDIKSDTMRELRDDFNETFTALIDSIKHFNSELGSVNILKTLDVRMINDRLMDLDRVLLCPDTFSRSQTDIVNLRMLFNEPTFYTKNNFKYILKCYKAAGAILLKQAYCKEIFEKYEE